MPFLELTVEIFKRGQAIQVFQYQYVGDFRFSLTFKGRQQFCKISFFLLCEIIENLLVAKNDFEKI